MDPDANLRELRDLARTGDDPDRMAELFIALDDWLTSGGFKPADWA